MEGPILGFRDCPDGFRRTDNSNLYNQTADTAKTAAYAVVVADRGKCFSNAGAVASVTFTLPTDATTPIGWLCYFFVAAAQPVVIAATSINGAASLTLPGANNGVGMVMVVMGPDAKYRASILSDIHTPLDSGFVALTTNGAITPTVPATYIITKAGVLADTLAAPTSGISDGVEISIYSGTNNAHTLTATGLLQTGAATTDVATFAAFAGAGLTLIAYQGKWMVKRSVGITFS